MGAEVAAKARKPPAARNRAAADGASSQAAGRGGRGLGNQAVLGMLAGLGGKPVMRAACSSCAGEMPGVSRKADCGCGGSCCDDQPSVARKADGGGGAGKGAAAPSVASVVSRPGRPLDRGTRRQMERSFGRDLSHVRVHTDADAAASARAINAHAYTVGSHIVFGGGRFAPERTDGRRLLAHELTHTVQQQSGRYVQPSGSVSRPTDPHEREADALADAVVAGHAVNPTASAALGVAHRGIGSWLLDKAESAVDAVGDAADAAGEALVDAGEAVLDAGEAVYDAGVAVVDAGVEFAEDVVDGIRWVWDLAHDIAAAIGGMISVSGCGISITVPSLDIPYAVALEIPLPELSATLPIAGASLPLGQSLAVYGQLYLNTTLAPSLALQLGPARFNGAHLMIDWCSPAFSGGGSLSWTFAGSLGAELRGGVGGEVGATVTVMVGGVPIPIDIPIVNVDAGVAGAILGIGATNVTHSVAFAAGGSGLSYAAQTEQDVGLRLSAGVGAFGSIAVLGQNLCRLYWPLWTKAWETSFSFDRGVAFSLGAGGPSLSLNASLRRPGDLDFSDFPVFLETDVLTDDCPLFDVLCRVLSALGLLPAQLGVGFRRYPWPGPLTMDQRDPGIASGSLCRGACGPNCDTCTPMGDRWVCVDNGAGRHSWVRYPNVVNCATHAACRQHDACYDVCGGGGRLAGLDGFMCHRLCDLECYCHHSAATCIGWALGQGGDDRMEFSDQPQHLPGCEGPCPTATVDKAGNTTYRLCLPDIELSPPVSAGDRWAGRTDAFPLYEEIIWIPDFGPVYLNLTTWGTGSLDVNGTIGPVMLTGVCLDVDPATSTYRGRASLVVNGSLNANAQIGGRLRGEAVYACLINLLAGEVGLTASASLAVPMALGSTVEITCHQGEVNLLTNAFFSGSLGLGFNVDADLILELFGFKVYRDRWNLFGIRREWPWHLELRVGTGATAGLVFPAFGIASVGMVELLRFLLLRDHEHEEPEPPGFFARRLLSLCRPSQPPAGPCQSPVYDGVDCGQPTRPYTRATWGPAPGSHVKAVPVTTCEDGNPAGSKPGRNVFRPLMNCHWTGDQGRHPPQRNVWKRAHLLHGKTDSRPTTHLHGPGNRENLIFTDQSINTQMEQKVETPAINHVYGQKKAIWYEVHVDHMDSSGQERYYGQRVHMRWGEYDPIAQRECPAIVNETITSSSGTRPIPCRPPYE